MDFKTNILKKPKIEILFCFLFNIPEQKRIATRLLMTPNF